MPNLITAPSEKVDPQDHKAIAAAILDLIEDSENHCTYAFAVLSDGEATRSPVTGKQEYKAVCLATAFTMVTGVEYNNATWPNEQYYMPDFSEKVFGERNICYVNNCWMYSEIIANLQKAASAKVN